MKNPVYVHRYDRINQLLDEVQLTRRPSCSQQPRAAASPQADNSGSLRNENTAFKAEGTRRESAVTSLFSGSKMRKSNSTNSISQSIVQKQLMKFLEHQNMMNS
jgi:hypothetical protein